MHHSNFIVLTILIFALPGFHGGRILVFTMDGSHWLNKEILIEELHSRGHNVTVVRPSDSWYIKEKSPHYNSITITRAAGLYENTAKVFVKTILQIRRQSACLLKFLKIYKAHLDVFGSLQRQSSVFVTAMFADQKLMKSLKEARYDLVLTDPSLGVGALLAHYLQLPLVNNARWSTAGEGHTAVAPSPLSYVPTCLSGLSDKMSFIERVKNVVFHAYSVFKENAVGNPHYQEVCRKYFGKHVDFYTLARSADLWLMRVDFVFEFPRPSTPNVVYIGGFHCKPPKPLPRELEGFVQGSGEHGVIVMSFGSLVSELPNDIADEVASAFAQLPQKVIWRYEGDRPATLGNNTLLVKWMPQSDLLGHPKTKVFVAHGGTNGVQEAIYHGIPVVGIPLFHDQFDNLLRLTERGAAKVVDIDSLDRSIFLRALQEVLHVASYRSNMQKLSRLHRDQPMRPLDRAVFWIEFVMRHKGAAHLRAESYRMPWYAYHCIDVICVLVAALFLILLTITTVIRYFCCKRKIKYD